MREIKEILEQEKNNLKIEMYWDYKDKLSNEQINEILKGNIEEVEQEIYENNIDYICDLEQERIKEILSDEELEDEDLIESLRENLEVDLNFDELLKNSSVNIRIELKSNSDMIMTSDFRKSKEFKEFKRTFKGDIDLKELNAEIDNLCCDYSEFVFYFKVEGRDLINFVEQVKKGSLVLRKGIRFGLHNSYIGSGSLLECSLKKDIILNLEDWRKPSKEILLEKLNDIKSSYYVSSVLNDNSGYGIQECCGLTSEGWVKWQ
jgi:hypothetical protein